MAKDNGKLPYVEFVLLAIAKAPKKGNSKGMHTVFSKLGKSSFNDAFRAYYGEEPMPIINRLAKQGKIFARYSKGGMMIYRPEDRPTTERFSPDERATNAIEAAAFITA